MLTSLLKQETKRQVVEDRQKITRPKKKKADFCEDIKVMQGNKLNLYLNIYTADILLW